MKVQLLRYDVEVSLSPEHVSTLEVLNRTVFARVVSSLLSEEGEKAAEPYQLWNDLGRRASPRKALLLVNNLPSLPSDNRTLLNKLYGIVGSELDASGMSEEADALGQHLRALLADATNGMWGQYEFGLDWNQAAFMKAFSLMPACEEGESLLENCIAFLGFCVDIKLDMPIVLVNAKSFFAREELDRLFEQAVFLGVELLLLESWHDDDAHQKEAKTVLDQDFLVTWAETASHFDRPMQRD